MCVTSALLATVLALVIYAAPASKEVPRRLGATDGETAYVFEVLATGDSNVVAEHGPITLAAVCRDHVRIIHLALRCSY